MASSFGSAKIHLIESNFFQVAGLTGGFIKSAGSNLFAMEERKQYSALTIDRAAFLLLRVKKAFKKKKLQRKERERR